MAFQLDSNIPLLARSADPVAAVQGGLSMGNSTKDFLLRKKEDPIRTEMLQGQRDRQELEFDIREEERADAQKKRMDAETDRQIKSTANGAQGLMTTLKGNDIEGSKKFLKRRIEDLTKRAQDGQPDPRKFQDTIEALNILESGDANQIQNLKDSANELIGIAESRGLLEMPKRGKSSSLQQGTGKLAGFVFNPVDGSFSIDPNIKAELEKRANIAADNDTELEFKDKQGLNKDITSILKDTVKVKRAAEELNGLKSLGSAAAKLGAVFKFMKAMDPTSVVRETEQGQVYAASGAASQLAGSINSLLGEGKLTDAGFEDLVNTAQTIANANITSVGAEVGTLLDSFGDSIDDEFNTKLRDRIPKPFDLEVAAEEKKVAKDAEAIDWARKNPTDPRAVKILSLQGG